MLCRLGAEIVTTRLDVVDGLVLQVGLAAVVAKPVSAVPAVSAVPVLCPEVWLHWTE